MLYWAIIRSLITYARETGVVNKSMEQKVFITESKIVRIFGPARKEMVHGELKQIMN
jgi:hypothetical protein